MDVETGNGWFTWNNRHGGEHHIASSLDIFLLSEGLVNGGGEVIAQVLPAVDYDHWPVCLAWEGTGPPI